MHVLLEKNSTLFEKTTYDKFTYLQENMRKSNLQESKPKFNLERLKAKAIPLKHENGVVLLDKKNSADKDWYRD